MGLLYLFLLYRCLYFFFFFKQKTAYEISACLVGSEMCIRDSNQTHQQQTKQKENLEMTTDGKTITNRRFQPMNFHVQEVDHTSNEKTKFNNFDSQVTSSAFMANQLTSNSPMKSPQKNNIQIESNYPEQINSNNNNNSNNSNNSSNAASPWKNKMLTSLQMKYLADKIKINNQKQANDQDIELEEGSFRLQEVEEIELQQSSDRNLANGQKNQNIESPASPEIQSRTHFDSPLLKRSQW
eukprot:TRINITY_DN3182_c0_g1_i11.p1 TRINITY_DN3182_c0_g1~~TRINITY_DN3182_c0_g1_i11.p1  ORF type:complete len:240 (-),score=42.46 TRINITY_DN3182_c0_g1_i11:217-936(-)